MDLDPTTIEELIYLSEELGIKNHTSIIEFLIHEKVKSIKELERIRNSPILPDILATMMRDRLK